MSNQTSVNNPHYDPHGRPLVPPAEQPFIHYTEQETVQETVWLNPTDKDVILKLYVGTRPVYSQKAKEQWRRMSPQKLQEAKSGHRTFIIRAGDRRAISSDFDQAIQQTICQEPDCYSHRMYCRNPAHHMMVIGGYGPQLVNERVQHRPTVHPSLIEEYARQEEAKNRAMEALRQKEAAEQALAVAQAEAMRAAAIRDAMKANEEKAQSAAGQPKKDK